MKGMIGCLRIPGFAAQIERHEAADAAGIILAENQRVVCAAPELLDRGLSAGMTLRAARALCPEARVLPARPLHYRQAAVHLHTLLLDMSPVVQMEEAYPAADLYAYCRLDPGSGGLAQARRILSTITSAMDLVGTMGVAANKFTGRCAAQTLAPGQVTSVAPGHERAWLATLPLSYLPLGLETARRLRLLGIQTLGALAALPGHAVLAQFGREGLACWRLAGGSPAGGPAGGSKGGPLGGPTGGPLGLDESPLLAQEPERSFDVTRVFDDALAERTSIEAALSSLVARLAVKLAAEGLAAGHLLLALATEDGTKTTGELALRQPLAGAKELSRAACSLLGQTHLQSGVIEMTLTAGRLTRLQPPQLDLFAHGGDQAPRLHAALTALAYRYHDASILEASVAHPAARLPERRFTLHEYRPV